MVVELGRHPASRAPLRNNDVSWDDFDTQGYLADNYTTLHDFDRRVINSLSPYYRSLPPRSLATSIDVGTGPNIYPFMLVAAASRHLSALDFSASNVAYLRRLRSQGPGPVWQPFWQLCRALNSALPPDFDQILRGLTIDHGSVFNLPKTRYDLVSMFFFAESVTGDREEFQEVCRCFASAAKAGGHLVAAFMTGMPNYQLGGRTMPALQVDESAVKVVLHPLTRDLHVWRLPADPNLPYQHDGALLLTARALGTRSET